MSIEPEAVQVADEPLVQAAPGVNDPCFGNVPHYWICDHPANSPISVRRCNTCGLIDGEDIRDQVAALSVDHPERRCHRCGGPNVSWIAPSPLWNQVMRGGDINGDEGPNGIVCPTCFAVVAQERGVAELWRLTAERVHVPLQTVTPSGRVWDEPTWMWVDPPPGPGDIACPTCGSGPGQFCIHQPSGDIRLSWHEARWQAGDSQVTP